MVTYLRMGHFMAEKSNRTRPESPTAWVLATLFAAPADALMLGLFYYWFALADRYAVFLYHHDMGPLVPDTSPFSVVTSSRYWMAGLVAAGLVMILYSAANIFLGRLAKSYRCPEWWRVWVVSSIPLAIIIPLIVMSVNQPTLPLTFAIRVIVATLFALALALFPGRIAAEQPLELLLLALDGFGLMFLMLNIISLEHLPGWIERGAVAFIVLIGLAFLIGVLFLGFVTVARIWLRKPGPGPWAFFIAGLCVSYLLMPVIHHFGFTDGYYYITDSDNFFARNIWLQLFAWLLVAGIAFAVYQLRRFLIDRLRPPAQV